MVETTVALTSNIELPKNSLLSRLPLVFMGLGIAALVYWATLYQADHSRAMFGYLFGFIVVLSLALGCLVFVLIQHVTRAGWRCV